MGNDRLYVLSEMPVRKAIITLALPTMLGAVVHALYNMADTFFIGKMNDPNAVAAITLSFPLFMLVQAFGNLFATGGASYISRALGKKEFENANKAASISFAFSLVVGVLMTAIALSNLDKILSLIGAGGSTFRYAKTYLSYIMAFAPVMLLQVSLSGIMRAEGATKEATIGMLTGTILNIILDPIFIISFNMGVEGAAIATVIGESVGLLYLIYYFLKRKGIISISPKYFSFDKPIISDIVKVGTPVAINQLLMSSVNTFANSIAASYGDHVIASMGINMRINSLAFMLNHGLAMGYQPFAGYCYGAKKYNRLIKGFKFTITIGAIYAGLFSVFSFTFAPSVIRAFIDNAEIISLGTVIMRAFAVPLIFMPVQVSIMVSFQAMGKALQSLLLSLGRQGLFFIPILLILNYTFALNGFIFAQPLSDFLSTCFAVLLFIRLWKQLRQEIAESRVKAEPVAVSQH
jgi:multidrug efflux pump